MANLFFILNGCPFLMEMSVIGTLGHPGSNQLDLVENIVLKSSFFQDSPFVLLSLIFGLEIIGFDWVYQYSIRLI